jgi:hypothetical protein
MKHKSMQIVGYAFGYEQTAALMSKVEAHLSVCQDCRDYVGLVQNLLHCIREEALETESQAQTADKEYILGKIKNGQFGTLSTTVDVKTGEIEIRDKNTGKSTVFQKGELPISVNREVAKLFKLEKKSTNELAHPTSRKPKTRTHGEE